MSLQTSRCFPYDVTIVVGERQFPANWDMLRANSLVFEEFYHRRKHRRKKINGDVNLVKIRGIKAGIVEKFLHYINGDTKKATQLVLEDIKAVIIFSVVFQLRELITLVRAANCFQNLDLSLSETGLGLVSKLHQGLLRFLFDRTLIYKTKKIAMFLAQEAYKQSNMEELLWILKALSGSRNEIRLKLLDIAIRLYSTDMDALELTEKGGDTKDNHISSLFPFRGQCHEVPATAAAGADYYTNRSKENAKAEEHRNTKDPRGSKNDFVNVTSRNALKVSFKKPEQAQCEEKVFIKGNTGKAMNGIENWEQATMKKTIEEKQTLRSKNLKPEKAGISSLIANNDKASQPIEHKTHELRKNVRKLWKEQNRVPVLFSSDNERKKTARATRRENANAKQTKRKELKAKVDGDNDGDPTNGVKGKNCRDISVSEIEVIWPENKAQDESCNSLKQLDSSRRCERESIFLTGGIQQNDYFARRVVLEFDPITNVYITHRAMQTTRYNHGVTQLHGDIYVAGGNSGCFEQLRAVESYCVETSQWSSQESMREARDEFSLAVCSGNLYAIGGHNGIHDLRTVEKFDPQQGVWSFVSPMRSLRAGACSVTVNDRYIFVAGGFSGDGYLDTVERYDTFADTWIEVEPMTTKRAYSCVVLSPPAIYVLGGFDGDVTLSSCELYDMCCNRWVPVPDMNTPRMNATAVLFRDNIFTFGGETDGVFLGSVECYDIQNKTWAFIQRLPQPTAGLRACVYQTCTYINR